MHESNHKNNIKIITYMHKHIQYNRKIFLSEANENKNKTCYNIGIRRMRWEAIIIFNEMNPVSVNQEKREKTTFIWIGLYLLSTSDFITMV